MCKKDYSAIEDIHERAHEIRKDHSVPENWETSFFLHERYGNKIVFMDPEAYGVGSRIVYYASTGEVALG